MEHFLIIFRRMYDRKNISASLPKRKKAFGVMSLLLLLFLPFVSHAYVHIPANLLISPENSEWISKGAHSNFNVYSKVSGLSNTIQNTLLSKDFIASKKQDYGQKSNVILVTTTTKFLSFIKSIRKINIISVVYSRLAI